MPGHSTQNSSLGTNVNTLFFQVSTLEFGHGAGARVRGLDLVLGHKSGHRAPVCTPFLLVLAKRELAGAVYFFVLAARLLFQYGFRQGEME